MVDVLFVPIHYVKLLVNDCDMRGQHIGRVPERLTQAVEVGLCVGKLGDALCVNRVVTVDALDNSVLHFEYLRKLNVQRVKRISKVGLCAVGSGDDGITCGDGGGAEIERVADDEILPVCFIDHAKAFDCVDHNQLWKILKEMGLPDHLTCLLRNMYVGQEATVN